MAGTDWIDGTQPIPPAFGDIADLAPVGVADHPAWLVLGADGRIIRWDIAKDEHSVVGTVTVPTESEQEPWNGHPLRRRLHAAADGSFAAVVNDYGRYGEVVDLRTAQVTMTLDSQEYHPETVPFSLAFTEQRGRCVLIHRTDWNRLDISDPATGTLLTDRTYAERRYPTEQPEHYLDYFHGALYVSPDGTRMLDDGWVWQPFGVPAVWDIDPWLDNPWESEDGPSRKIVCGREYWDHAMTWLDNYRFAIAGIGADEQGMRSGARIFDTRQVGEDEMLHGPTVAQLLAFEGPAGRFFSDGQSLFSSDDSGLSAWDVANGTLRDKVPDFSPTHYHRGAQQFLQIDAGVVRLHTARR